MNIGVGWVYVLELDEICEVIAWTGLPYFLYDTVVASSDNSDGLTSFADGEVERLSPIELLLRAAQGVTVVTLRPESYAWLEGECPVPSAFSQGQG